MKRSLAVKRMTVAALLLAQVSYPAGGAFASDQYMYRHKPKVITYTGPGGPIDPAPVDPDPENPETPLFQANPINGNSETLAALSALPSIGIRLYKPSSTEVFTGGATWQMTSGQLPPGVTAEISQDGSTLLYTGYPTTVGTFGDIVWTITGSNNKKITTQPQTFIVNPRVALALSTNPSTDRTVAVNTELGETVVTASNVAYEGTLTPDSWSVSGDLPEGITYTLAGNSVRFSGIPTEVGSFDNVVVSATDSAGGSATTSLTFNVTAKPSLVYATNIGTSDQVLTQYTSQPILAMAVRYVASNEGYNEGAAWTLASGTLPPGITANIAANGSFITYSGYPTEMGTWGDIKWLVEDANGDQIETQPVSFTVNPRADLVLTALPGSDYTVAAYGDPASLEIRASNLAYGSTLTPQDWSVTGTLPKGITHSSNGNILTFSGVAEEEGDFSNVTVTATDIAGGTATANVRINAIANPAPFTATITGGQIVELAQYTKRATNGVAVRNSLSNEAYEGEVTWTLVSGTLPPGVTYTTTGNGLAYSGYPTATGTWDNIVWQISEGDYRLRTVPVTFVVETRGSLELVASSNLRQMSTLTDPAAVTVSASNTLLGNAIPEDKWAVAGTLPAGVTYVYQDGGIRFVGRATATGTYSVTVTAEDADGITASTTIGFEVTASVPPYVLSNVNGNTINTARVTSSVLAKTEVLDRQTNTAYGSAVTWSLVSGTLPPGVTATADPVSGQFMTYSGVPTTVGTWGNIVWAVSNSVGHVVQTQPITFNITERATLTLAATPADKQVVAVNIDTINTTITASNLPYNSTIAPEAWTVTGLPPGLTAPINNGVLTLSGKPTATGIYTITVSATDTKGAVAQAVVTLEVYTNVNSFKQVALGQHHTCGLTLSGGVKCWGWNGNGQLGDNSTTNRLTPVDVVGLQSGVRYVTAGHEHSCAILNSGEVKCWGNQSDGRLGNGITAGGSITTPITATQAGSNMKQLSAGAFHTCGVTNSGAAMCFGNNTYGGIGDNSTAVRAVATTPQGMGSGVAMITAGNYTTCAAKTDGSAWCWGLGNLGQLGNSAKLNSSVPVQAIAPGNGVTKVETRGFSTSHGHSCALTNTGIRCWGRNADGQLGIGNNTDQVTPQSIASMSNAVDMAVAIAHTCGVKADRSLWCWGFNGNGRVGDGTSTGRNTPTATIIGRVTGITAGGDSACAPTTDGVFCWGGNRNGALGDGSTTTRFTPVPLVY